MANSQRDERGRFSSSSAPNGGGAAINPAADAAPRGPAASISPEETPAARQSLAGSLSPSSSIAHDDDWGAADLTGALLNRPAGGTGGGGAGESGGANKELIPDPDYEEGFGKLKFDGPELGKEVLNAGMANHEAGRAAGRTAYDTAMRAGGYGGNESAGQHTVSAPGGPAYHGSNIPGGGIPRPGDYGGAPGGGPRDWSPGSGGTPGVGDGTINPEQGDDGVWGVGNG